MKEAGTRKRDARDVNVDANVGIFRIIKQRR